MIPDPKRLFCETCEAKTTYIPVGENIVGRPVRECVECGFREVGRFDRAPIAVATDGGEES